MNTENKVENFRSLWEEIMLSNKLMVCTEELKGAGIMEVNVLRLLFKTPEIVPKQIVEKLNIPNSTLTNIINRLQKKGLITRKLNTDDLRSLQLLLTDKGMQAIQSHHDAEKVLIQNILDLLSEEESNLLVKVFEKISCKLV